MDTSIKRLLEVAGVDITKGKAKQLCESDEGQSHIEARRNRLCVWTQEGERAYVISDIDPNTTQAALDAKLKKLLGEEVWEVLADQPAEMEIVSEKDKPHLDIKGLPSKSGDTPTSLVNWQTYVQRMRKLYAHITKE